MIAEKTTSEETFLSDIKKVVEDVVLPEFQTVERLVSDLGVRLSVNDDNMAAYALSLNQQTMRMELLREQIQSITAALSNQTEAHIAQFRALAEQAQTLVTRINDQSMATSALAKAFTESHNALLSHIMARDQLVEKQISSLDYALSKKVDVLLEKMATTNNITRSAST